MIGKNKAGIFLIIVLVASIFLSGCAPLWFAGGAAAGAAIVKDAEDGEIIDD